MDANNLDDLYLPSILIDSVSQQTESQDIDYKGIIVNDQYRIERVLTGGSLGRVFECRDITTGSDVVLKSIRADAFAHPEKLDALAAEVRNWMHLPRCANLVNILSVCYDDNEQTLYFAMPFIHGHPKYGLELEDWKKSYRFTELDMLYTGIAVCSAVKECFQQKGAIPVHGDIKPSNIFVEYVGDRFENMPFLSCNIRLADCGAVGCTTQYLPEEYCERSLPPDQASDVYALIRVLGEMENYADAGYDRETSAIHGLYKMIVEQNQWKMYNLIDILDDFLLPVLQGKFRIRLEILLHQDVRSRPMEIFYRAQDIHSALQMVRKEDSLLDELDALWNEAHSCQYVIRGIPLTCYIDRSYFVCAGLCARYELARQVLHRYEKMLFSLSSEQQKVFGCCYSTDLRNDFAILYAINYKGQGQNGAAIALFHKVSLESCISYKWLEEYIELCFLLIGKGNLDEGLHLQRKIKSCISTYNQSKGQRSLFDLKCALGIISFYLGQTAEGIHALEECAAQYPNNLWFLYNYGYALLLDGQITKARYPLHILYYRCQEVRKRNHDGNGRPLYPAQTVAMYSFMSAYMVGEFSAALENLNEFSKQFDYYQSQSNSYHSFFKNMIEESYNIHRQLRQNMSLMSVSDIIQNYHQFYSIWEEYLSFSQVHLFYLAKRGELQVLSDLHTLLCDQLLVAGQYDEVIQLCQNMLSIWKDSISVKRYLARAYAMKRDASSATRFYIESADMLKYAYPRFPPNGTESSQASAERNQMRKEMIHLGLDDTVI